MYRTSLPRPPLIFIFALPSCPPLPSCTTTPDCRDAMLVTPRTGSLDIWSASITLTVFVAFSSKNFLSTTTISSNVKSVVSSIFNSNVMPATTRTFSIVLGA